MGATVNGEPDDADDRRQPADSSVLPLIAYRTGAGVAPALVPAAAARTWMDRTSQGFARRCLPLLIANQAGWFLLGTHSFDAVWDGGAGQDALQLHYTAGAPPVPAVSHFGHGILTFRIPYLFRTPPGWNLLARGPANWPVPGAVPLEGVVETDWAVATFTMNWQLTSPGMAVTFLAGDPFCLIVPQARGELERFRPEVRDLGDAPDLQIAYSLWRHERDAFLQELPQAGTTANLAGWQRDYFQGRGPDEIRAPVHQTRLALAPPVTTPDDDPPAPPASAPPRV